MNSALRTKGDERGWAIQGITREASLPSTWKNEPQINDSDDATAESLDTSALEPWFSYKYIALYVDLCAISGYRKEKKWGYAREGSSYIVDDCDSPTLLPQKKKF